MRRINREERGVAVVMVALWLPLMVLFLMFVVEVGNWYVHKRHLQAQTDAAAFAGGAMFNSCFFPGGGGDAAVFNEATKYAGSAGSFQATSFGTAQHNEQIGGLNKGSVAVVYQSKTQPTAGPASDDTETQGPCETPHLMFDVKASEAGLPLFLSSFIPGLSSTTINAHARVQLRRVQIARQALPLAVPDVNPKQVGVTFVDESSGAELSGCSGSALIPGTTCSFYLSKSGNSGGLTLWGGSGTVNIPAAGKNVGVRVGLGGQVQSCANATGGTNSVCYDNTQTSRGLVQIRSFAGGGGAAQPNPPKLYGVWPTSGCSGSPFFSDAIGSSSCAVGVQATVDFGTGATNPTNAKTAGGVKAILQASINGTPVSLSPDSYDAATDSWLWSTSGFPVSVPVNRFGSTSAYSIALNWEEQDGIVSGNTCKANNGNKCTGSFGAVQRFTSATDDDDGPVKLVQLSEPSSSTAPYSLLQGTHTLSVTVGLKGSLSVPNPPQLTALRLTGGSRTTGVNCDGTGDSDFTDAIRFGCKTPYQINDADLCPDPSPPAGPKDCVPLKTGNLGNTVIKALNDRFSPCTPNNWPNYVPGDKRIVQLMVTDYSALDGSGKVEVPVTNFATFYVAGWSGNNCGDTWPAAFGSEPNGGNIWGYFIKYVNTLDSGGTQVCDPTSVTPCTPVMTR
jgi:hypothetical protein